jgi:hypothetical protein
MTEQIVTPAEVNAGLRSVIVLMMVFQVVLIGLVVLFAYRLAGLSRRLRQLEDEQAQPRPTGEEAHVLTQAEMLADDRPIPAVRPKTPPSLQDD